MNRKSSAPGSPQSSDPSASAMNPSAETLIEHVTRCMRRSSPPRVLRSRPGWMSGPGRCEGRTRSTLTPWRSSSGGQAWTRRRSSGSSITTERRSPARSWSASWRPAALRRATHGGRTRTARPASSSLTRRSTGSRPWPTTSTTAREPDVSDVEAPNGEDASGRRTGRWAEHDPHGGTIVGDYLEGERTGEWTHYFADGRVRSVSQYIAGRLTGPATWYRATGGLLQTGGFVDGEKHGLWRRWNTAGELLDEGEFDHGSKTGRW